MNFLTDIMKQENLITPRFMGGTETAAALREYGTWILGGGVQACGEESIHVGAPFTARYIGELMIHAADMLSVQCSDQFNDEAYDI